jgi:KDO2-lipid IV(A) lauroyltransferase
MKITLLRIFIHLLSLFPLSAARLLGRVFGSLAWQADTRMARTTRTNLRLCFPDLEEQALEQLGRESLQQTLQTIMEAGAIWLWPPDRTLGLIHTVTGQEKLAAAVHEGRGVLVIAPHLGNWELFGLYLNNCGCGQSWQLYQPPDSRELDSFILQARSRGGARMVPTDNKGVGELLKALRRGEIAGILPDQVPPDSGGEFAPFFGIPALTMTLFNRLQQKTGARVLVGVALRRGPGFEIRLTDPDPGVYAKDMPTALSGLNRSIEAIVKDNPGQYQWEYKRFKRQPPGQAARYDR